MSVGGDMVRKILGLRDHAQNIAAGMARLKKIDKKIETIEDREKILSAYLNAMDRKRQGQQ